MAVDKVAGDGVAVDDVVDEMVCEVHEVTSVDVVA